MVKEEDVIKLKEAFLPEITIEGFQDLGEVIVARVKQEFPRLIICRRYVVAMNKESGDIQSMDWLLSK